mmetsp:Transcript_2506/g.2761  ORF Transcript_2506/g.2761 Transcript_2506/m.2761 type:complete len:639 (-) Transcript_2506:1437-3353(-)
MSGRGRGCGRGRGRGRGRGEYYKNKYGRGGRDNGRGGGSSSNSSDRVPTGGGSVNELKKLLRRLDGKQYPAYHDVDTPMNNGWYYTTFKLYCERAQSDPFAPPTRCRVVVDAAHAGFPKHLYSNRIRSMALGDYLLRVLHGACKRLGADSSMNDGGSGSGSGWSGKKGGDIQVLEPCQSILEQSGVFVDPNSGNIVAQITVNLPARGRSILGHAAETIFCQTIPTMVERVLYASLSADQLKNHIEMVEDQVWLQKQLESRNIVAFVRNGAILPRRSGADDKPMDCDAVPFKSPSRLEMEFVLPNSGNKIAGMGILKGITLICGGGFHGKSTLLQTIQIGLYPKISGDGREFCMTSVDACKIRAEDGRNVKAVDISNFINNLPFGKDTTCFSSMDASGSTSQATNIVEVIECGANALLIDEDTCATNFMIRDDKMMQLVAADKEPITPFVQIVRSLYEDCQVSSVMVIGGTGDYFDVADNVLVMDSYKCYDATERAKAIVASSAKSSTSSHTASQSVKFRSTNCKRFINGSSFVPNGKVKTISKNIVNFGEIEIDLSCLEQLVSKAQTTAISAALQQLPEQATGHSFIDTLEQLVKRLDNEGLAILAPGQFHGGMARPRIYEIAGAINRLRMNSTITQG